MYCSMWIYMFCNKYIMVKNILKSPLCFLGLCSQVLLEDWTRYALRWCYRNLLPVSGQPQNVCGVRPLSNRCVNHGEVWLIMNVQYENDRQQLHLDCLYWSEDHQIDRTECLLFLFSFHERLMVFLIFYAVHCRKARSCWTGLLSGGI